MDNLNELKKLYQRQDISMVPGSFEEIFKKSKYLKQQLIWRQIILGITAVVLIGFFIYISAHKVLNVALALGLMIGVLVIRVLLELFSMLWLRKLDYSQSGAHFQNHTDWYIKFRRVLQLWLTPIFFLTYVMAFVVLLPYFKASLSEGFYLYILISGAITLSVLAVIIGMDVRKEMLILKRKKQ